MPNAPPMPRIRRAGFYKRGDEFFEAIHEDMDAFLGDGPDRWERWERLTDAQRAAHSWQPFYFHLEDDDLSQFFHVVRGDKAASALGALLRLAGKGPAAEKLERAAGIYQADRTAAEAGLADGEDVPFGLACKSDLGAFVRPVGRAALGATKFVEKWVREHIDEIAVGDDGRPIDPEFTGAFEVRDADGRLVERAEVRRGLLHGVYQTFDPDGTPARTLGFSSGKRSGSYWPNGQVRERTVKSKGLVIREWFHPSGAIWKRYASKSEFGDPVEPVRVWHENGRLAEENHRDVRKDAKRPFLRFFDDGSPRLEAEFSETRELVIHDAWDDRREQTVKNGDGSYFDDGLDHGRSQWLRYDGGRTSQSELRGGVRHGVETVWTRGVPSDRVEWFEGEKHGDSLHYHRNGRVIGRTRFKHGSQTKFKRFPAFDSPRPVVRLEFESDAALYDREGLTPPDEFPTPTNLQEVQASIPTSDHLQKLLDELRAGERRQPDVNEFQDVNGYWIDVDERGEVASLGRFGCRPRSGDDLAALLARLMRFTPARRKGRAVASRALVRVVHEYGEGTDA